jgi:uncharacterized metal-binding protein
MVQCSCGGDCKVNLVMACSGIADVGELADKVYRKLVKDGVGAGFCLAGIGAGKSGFVQSARTGINIVIDGCPVNCGKKILDKIGSEVKSFTLAGLMGLEKGKTPVTDELIETTVNKIKEELSGTAGA